MLICPPAENHFVRIDQPADAEEVLFVNHVHIAVAVERVFADHALNLAFEQGQERILDLAADEQIIRRDAGLARVQQLAEGNAPGGQGNVGALIHDDGAFAAQFQQNGGQVDAGLFHDQAAHRHSAGEEDAVEPLVQQGGVLPAAALDYRDPGGVEHLCQQGGHGMAGGRGVGAGL